MDAPFADRFLEATGYGLSLVERAKAGKLADLLTVDEIAELIAEDRRHLWTEAEWTIRHACYIGQLKSRVIPGESGTVVPAGPLEIRRDPTRTWTVAGETETVYIIHRDDARRYFAALDMMPAEGSALHCWLYRKTNGARQLRPDQQDKADFQQLCIDHWEHSPTTPNGAKGTGVVDLCGAAYQRAYKRDTLQEWASEVAPPQAKVGGRPKKPKPPV